MHALTGGCLCGAIRYRVEQIFDVVYCHCGRCRKRSGAPVSLSLVVEKSAFHVTQGIPQSYAGSNVGETCFCARCGSQLFFIDHKGPYVSVSHGSLDDPADVLPKAHQWVQNTLPWLHIDDALPVFHDGHLTHPAKR